MYDHQTSSWNHYSVNNCVHYSIDVIYLNKDPHFNLHLSLDEGWLKEMEQHRSILHKYLHFCNKILQIWNILSSMFLKSRGKWNIRLAHIRSSQFVTWLSKLKLHYYLICFLWFKWQSLTVRDSLYQCFGRFCSFFFWDGFPSVDWLGCITWINLNNNWRDRWQQGKGWSKCTWSMLKKVRQY